MESFLAARTATVSAAAVSTVFTSLDRSPSGSGFVNIACSRFCRPWWRRRAPARRVCRLSLRPSRTMARLRHLPHRRTTNRPQQHGGGR
ncbi:hypothetical protein ACP70R_008922 [Stipagrostis hirtigluma subsp. patula]